MIADLDELMGTAPVKGAKVECLPPGIYPDIPHDVYHAMHGYVSNSYLSRLNKCPAAAKVPQEDTPALLFGRAVHCYVLEGEEEFFKQFCVAPAVNKRTNGGKAEWAEFCAANPGKGVITADEMRQLTFMREAVYQHPFARMVLADGKSEQTVIWADSATGIKCKCRPDRIPSNGAGVLVDLKTTTDAGEYGFGRSVANYGYARQAAMYLDGINAASGSDFDAFVFVAVEKEPPYRVEVYELDPEFIEWGRMDYQRLLQIEAQCREQGEYPNRQSNEMITLYKPKYL